MNYDFPFRKGNVIIPTDELIFLRGVGIPPTSPMFMFVRNVRLFVLVLANQKKSFLFRLQAVLQRFPTQLSIG